MYNEENKNCDGDRQWQTLRCAQPIKALFLNVSILTTKGILGNGADRTKDCGIKIYDHQEGWT